MGRQVGQRDISYGYQAMNNKVQLKSEWWILILGYRELVRINALKWYQLKQVPVGESLLKVFVLLRVKLEGYYGVSQ